MKKLKYDKSIIKVVDPFFGQYLHGPVTARIVPFFAWLRLRPNDVTIISLLVGLLAAFYIAQGGYTNYVIGGILVQVGLYFDMIDGQLARYTKQGSEFGAYFDVMSDRVKEFVILFALAYSFGTVEAYQLMFLAIFILAMRHYDYYERAKAQKGRVRKPFKEIQGMERFKAVIKESILFPISERWTLITLLLVFQLEYAILWVYIIYGGFIVLVKAVGGWYAYRQKST